MIRLVKTDRKPKFEGVTPAWIVGATLFVISVLTAHFAGRHFHRDFTPCLFKWVTHQPCFLCGGTRASLHLASGHPVEAFQFNPLVTVILSYFALAIAMKFGFARRFALEGFFKNRRFQWIFVVTLVLANWVYEICH